MGRPKKERIICAYPQFFRFSPTDAPITGEVTLSLDEYEVLRLHDFEHLKQAEVAHQMKISRPTVTDMLDAAHGKLAEALVKGRAIRIDGGCVAVCPLGKSCPYVTGDCPKKHRCSAYCRCGLYMDKQKEFSNQKGEQQL